MEASDQQFANVLKEHGTLYCPSCGKVIDRGDVAWNNASTHAGTPYSSILIECLRCDTEILYLTSWFEIDSFAELVDVLARDWKQESKEGGV